MRELLKQVCIFNELSDEQFDVLENNCRRRKLMKNTVVVFEGDLAETLFIVESGKLKVMVTDEDGNELVLTELHSGSYFGELGILSREKRAATVITTSACSLLEMNKDDFSEMIRNNGDMALALLESMAKFSRNQVNTIKSFALKDVYGRLVKTLEDLAQEEFVEDIVAEPCEGKTQKVITPKLTQKELASRIGATRERVAKLMKDLSRGGYLEVTDKAIVLKKKLPASY